MEACLTVMVGVAGIAISGPGPWRGAASRFRLLLDGPYVPWFGVRPTRLLDSKMPYIVL